MTDNYEQAETTDPHAEAPEEDPLAHLGEVLPDPWDDEGQTDWANHTVDLDPKTMGV